MDEYLRNEHGEVIYVKLATGALVEIVKEDHTGFLTREYNGTTDQASLIEKDLFYKTHRPATKADLEGSTLGQAGGTPESYLADPLKLLPAKVTVSK